MVRKIRSLFENVNQHDYQALLDALAPKFEHFVFGNHSLSGLRTRREDLAEWYARLFRVLPELKFTLRRLQVEGPPWRTLAVMEWNAEYDDGDGARLYGGGVFAVNLRWGRITRLVVLPDTERLVAILDRMAAAGKEEAHALPIDVS